VSTSSAVIVVDLGFGDAGKGLVTDALVRQLGAHTVVRFNGGAQAGHNVVLDDGRHHAFAQLGAGTFVPGVATYLSRFVVFHPTALLVEAERLMRLGVTDALARMTVDAHALVTTPFHVAANRLRESARGEARHGSSGVGLGETMADAKAGELILASQLRDATALRARAVRMQERKRAELADVVSALRGDPFVERERLVLESSDVVDAWLERAVAVARRIRIGDEGTLATILSRPGAVVFEGAQGVLIDEHFGFHPHTTWSNCTFDNALSLISEQGFASPVVRLGVLRTYAVRHGAGPLPTADPALDRLLPEPHNVDGPWQGAFRRGWFDGVLVRYALQAVRGVDALAITHVDTAASMTAFRSCTSYRLGDDVATMLPLPRRGDLAHQEHLTRILQQSVPILQTVDGPSPATTILDRLEDELKAPIALVARGRTARHVERRSPLVPGRRWGAAEAVSNRNESPGTARTTTRPR
jgi:adenylosuccinate synthase